MPSASGTARLTPSTLRTRSSAEAGMLMVCSTDCTAGSITHTSVAPFSEISAKPLVMKPQKYEAAKVTRKEVNAIPNNSPTNFARSAASIFSAMRNISAVRPPACPARRPPR
ncbi:hypothetical protein [Rhodanobacter thiooxydans]|uniref:hypothetical protein n=1 Tax=Rhodanobacter thiooxydans TaxID=416169 RepID=UPI0031B59156